MPASTDVVIQVSNLVKHYKATKAVDGVSFAVQKGEIFGLLGPNGAGKTTTIEMIEGLRKPDSGSLSVLGFAVQEALGEVKESIGVQLQASAAMDRLTIWETLDLFQALYRHRRDRPELLAELNLTEKKDTLTMDLSGGQKQRLAIGLALINDPLVVFLDEPTTGLDPQARRSLWEVIRRIQKQGKTIFLTTHYMQEAEALCDRVGIMDHGKLLAIDSPRGLVEQHFKEKIVELVVDLTQIENVQTFVTKLKGIVHHHLDHEEGVLYLYTQDAQTLLGEILNAADTNNFRFQDMRVRSASLEDVFIKLTGSKIRD